MRKKVLIFTGFYLPSVKGGGPIQSIKNIVKNLSTDYEFYIVTSDKDLGDDKPFEGISQNQWNKKNDANVYYINPKKMSYNVVRKIIQSENFDTIYLNGFFIYRFSIIPIMLKKFNLIKPMKIVLAPRGEFSPGALSLKKTKKKLYIAISKKLKLYSSVIWHATANSEKQDIENIFSANMIATVGNLTENYECLDYNKKIIKEKGKIKIVFISRIHPKKNLLRAIEILEQLEGFVEFNIYGPIEDAKYWDECQKKIEELPKDRFKVQYHGAIKHHEVKEAFETNHIFLFPTLGENFGHVISESLINGCPVIISDQTPWRNLEQNKVGWDINLLNFESFVDKVQFFLKMEQDQYDEYSKKAFIFAKKQSNFDDNVIEMKKLFS